MHGKDNWHHQTATLWPPPLYRYGANPIQGFTGHGFTRAKPLLRTSSHRLLPFHLWRAMKKLYQEGSADCPVGHMNFFSTKMPVQRTQGLLLALCFTNHSTTVFFQGSHPHVWSIPLLGGAVQKGQSFDWFLLSPIQRGCRCDERCRMNASRQVVGRNGVFMNLRFGILSERPGKP